MSSRSLFNLILAGIAIALGVIAWFRPGLEPPATPQPISTLSAAQINHIQVSRLQRPSLTFTRQADHWLLDGDHPLPASPFQVNALLAILQAQTTRHYPANSLDLRELGLDPPQATVIMDNSARLLIGNTEPLDNMRYLQFGSTIYLVEDRYQHLINADRTNFIERRLLGDGAVITRLDLPDLTLAQAGDGHWKLTPENTGISADAIQQLLTSWEQASALYVRPYEKGTPGTNITLEIAGSDTPVVFEVVSLTPEFILARPDLAIQYHLSTGSGERLLGIREPAPAAPADATVVH